MTPNNTQISFVTLGLGHDRTIIMMWTVLIVWVVSTCFATNIPCKINGTVQTSFTESTNTGKPTNQSKMMMCLGQEVPNMKDCFKGFMECGEKYLSKEDMDALKNPSETETANKRRNMAVQSYAKNMCVSVCQWKEHLHLITETGSWNSSAQDLMIDSVFPEAARYKLKEGLYYCYLTTFQKFSEKNNCASYKPFQRCWFHTILKVCKTDVLLLPY